ncbi:hypothetical protein HHK36_015510 [Tetracentron sinense]|uniref:COBRA-like protein n=1 Tax=Tetracentron sinense TaxID=13715 RepID=A0A834Z6B2_TETSI|nr:hypothetical protein HHK36_015510 [Tetracentron sinense]
MLMVLGTLGPTKQEPGLLSGIIWGFQSSATRSLLDAVSARIAEAKAIFISLTIASSKGWSRFILEGDANQIVDALNNKDADTHWDVSSLVKDITALWSQFPRAIAQAIPRLANGAAHVLAKQALDWRKKGIASPFLAQGLELMFELIFKLFKHSIKHLLVGIGQAVVTMYNFQQYRHIQALGWTLGWTWAKKEVIWSMMGGQTTEQGDCSKFKGNIPHCCKKDPTVVDLLPGTPYNQQIANCCKGGVINSWAQDPANAMSSFQLSVGVAGTSNKTIRVPKNFTLKAPGPGYTLTWNVTCTYSQFLSQKNPTCCVSLSSYNDSIVPCPRCTRGCRNNITLPAAVLNDTAMLWGMKFYNDLLMQAGPLGNVQSEILFRKDKATFTLDKGWAFPRRIYFNGDNCVMPPPEAYPWLPNASSRSIISLLSTIMSFLAVSTFLLANA